MAAAVPGEGWNDPALDLIRDAEWALREVQRGHPAAQVHVIGYSTGGRTAPRRADEPAVVGVCAFAPWIEAGEPVALVARRRLFIARGERDRTADPRLSRAYADPAAPRGCRRTVPADTRVHAMLRRAGRWNALVREFVGALTPSAAG